MKNGIKLSVPVISGKGTQIYGKTPKELAEEVLSLPFDDIPCALTIARKKLESLNRIDIDGAQRAIATEPFNVAYGRIATYYQSFFGSSKFSRTIDDNEFSELGRLTQELSFAYKHILRSFLVLPKHDKEKAQFAYMAMFYIGQSMMQSYDQYTWFSPQLWRELHDLYAYSERKGYLSQERYDPIDPQYSQTISETYAQICATALADPYHLKPGENWVVYHYIRNWANHIDVLPPINQLSGKNCFCINVNSALRPFPLGTQELTENADLRWLSLKKLQDVVGLHRDQLEAGHPPHALGLGDFLAKDRALKLLETLSVKWEKAVNRLEDRREIHEKLQIIWGISDIFQYLNPEYRREAMLRNNKKQDLHTTICITENVSANGVCLNLPAQSHEDLSVGQMALILKKTPQGVQSRLGSVCWTAKSGKMVKIGMRLVVGKPKAIQIKPESDQLQERGGILLVAARPHGKSIDSLFAPNDLLEISDRLELNTPQSGESYEVHTTALLDRTGFFDQFKFEPIYH